jgi:hypothetical protein
MGGSGGTGGDGGAPCECPPHLPPVNITNDDLGIPLSFDATTTCPIWGGPVGLIAGAHVTAAVNPLTCDEGTMTCHDSASIKASIDGHVHFCTESIDFGGDVSFGSAQTQCAHCDPSTSKIACDAARTCTMTNGGGSLNIGKTWHYGIKVNKTVGGSGWVPAVSIKAVCGADVGLSGSFALSGSGTKNKGFSCGECVDCATYEGDLSITGSATAHCSATLKVSGLSYTLGCASCGSASIALNAGGSHQSGACGAQTCEHVGGSLGGEMGPISKCVSILWFSVTGTFGVKASIAGNYDTCTGGHWTPDYNVDFKVTSGADCDSPPVQCCDGTPSPTCMCGGPLKGCCSHHGGVCGCVP